MKNRMGGRMAVGAVAVGVACWFAGLVAFMLLGVVPSGCAPQPTTKLNLMSGAMESPKDWKAESIEVDSSAAMQAQAEAFRAAGEAMGEMAKKVSQGVAAGAVKAVKGPVP